ncbi:DUF4383 domain-containing protein [Streptomyces sp. MUM 203J]|uniref:DUF4383 domain-containing protein n=1 Tax=Streptomyces sp. MUM 203J TaxID=2791990 RepID=UPI001F044387|nr:DUF4383 domain-containing protein [Streptomyces sp. MUM 203J]MCH0541417.1 DUF4383 domain-containing protein [Streptomyces sp. MUM 203J]
MTSARGRRAAPRAPVQYAALLVGVVFLLLGTLGFVPGVTTGRDGLEFAGHGSSAELLGLFQVSVLHNTVHLVYGVAGVAAALVTAAAARWYLLIGGLVYVALALYGGFVEPGGTANFVPFDTAGNWLHFTAGIVMVGLGAGLPRRAEV